MAYISRDDNGKISAVFDTPQDDAQEQISINSAELNEFLQQSTSSKHAIAALSASDIEMIRVLEDLVDTLIDKDLILFTDLPEAAREKLINRTKVRGQLNNADNLIGDDTGIL